MIKYREILRLRDSGVSVRNIAYSCGCSKSTVQTVLAKAKAKGLGWPLPEEVGDADIYAILFPKERREGAKAEPDFDLVHKELSRKGVTLMLCRASAVTGCWPMVASPTSIRRSASATGTGQS